MTYLSPQHIESASGSSNVFHRIICTLCDHYGLGLFPHDEWNILELVCESNRRFIWKRKFDLNSGPSMRLADNKYECSVILKSRNIPTLDYTKINMQYTNGQYSFEKSSAELIRKSFSCHGAIVLKPNAGYNGNDVFLCNSFSEAINVVGKMSFPHKCLVMSPYLPIRCEYRVIILDNQGLLVYRKNLAHVVGDGYSTIAQLINQSELNPDLITPSKSHSYIAELDETILLGWQHNLAKGAQSEIVKDIALLRKLTALAAKAATAIGIRFASVDILKLENGLYNVIEINSGVVLEKFINEKADRYSIVYQIYEKAIQSMFNLG